MTMETATISPLERAALAVENLLGTHCECDRQFPTDPETIARAVLQALREPSEAQIIAGIIERHDASVPEAWKLATANIYTAMIDAALEE